MPAYEYELVNAATGKTIVAVTAIVPVAQRDRLVVRRRTVPKSVAIAGAARNPNDAGRQVLGGYYKLEQKLGSRFRSSFTREQITAAHGRRKVDD